MALKSIKAGKEHWKRIDSHDIFGMSAKTTYYLLLSFFPLTLLLLTVASGLDLSIFEFIIPPSVLSALEGVIDAAPRGNVTVLSSVLLVWSASSAIWALMKGFHLIHTGERYRNFGKGRGLAMLFVLALAIFALISVSLTFLSRIAVNWLSSQIGFNRNSLVIIHHFVMFIFIFLFVLFLYILTPETKQKKRYQLFGAAFSAIGWLLSSWGFEVYMRMFNNYSLLYGGVGAFLGLALWFYIISIILFCGAELNAIIHINKSRKSSGPWR